MKISIFLILVIFSLSNSAPNNFVQVKIHCKLDVTSKLECFLPQTTLLTDVVEIVSSIGFSTTRLSDEEVEKNSEF